MNEHADAANPRQGDMTASLTEEQLEWWGRGMRDGLEAGTVAAGLGFCIIGEALDAGDVQRARMLVSLYQEWFALERFFPRREDGRLDAVDLILDRQYLDALRGNARDSGKKPDGGGVGRGEGTGEPG